MVAIKSFVLLTLHPAVVLPDLFRREGAVQRESSAFDIGFMGYRE